MATLTIRNLNAQVEESLRVRAARKGCSVEEEASAILDETVAHETVNLAEAIRRRFALLGGVELEPPPPVAVGQPPRFED